MSDFAPPNIQFRSQFVVSIENTIHRIADSIPSAIFIYKVIQRINVKFILAMTGIKNPWVIFAILLFI